MKILIAFVLTITLALAGETTILEAGGVKTTIRIDTNSANSSNVDLAFSVDYADTFPAEDDDTTNVVVCVDAGDSKFTIANSSTSLSFFALQWVCTPGAGNCTDIASVDDSFDAYQSNNCSTSASGVITTTGAATFNQTFTSNRTVSTNTAVRKATGITATEMEANRLPNKTSTNYYMCYGALSGTTSENLGSGVANVATTFTQTNNLTLKGSAKSIIATVAVIGSLVTSMTF